MAFIPKTWVDDQIVYAADMNRIEQGIAETDTLLQKKVNTADFQSHTANKSNPHGVTAVQTGAYSKGETDTLLSSKPNPNLLDNSIFLPGCLVDQRGGYIQIGGTMMYRDPEFSQEFGPSDGTTPVVMYGTYARPIDNGIELALYIKRSDCVRGYTGAGYGIDRWKANGSTVTVIVEDDEIQVIDNATDWNGIFQLFENWKAFAGKTATLSALGYTVGVKHTLHLQYSDNTSIANTSFPTDTLGLVSITTKIPDSIDNKFKVRTVRNGVSSGNSTLHLKAIKLELGSQQTLAHQENGVWVLNEIPDYVEQLARCQRYFQLYSASDKRPAKAVDCRPVMRTDPAQGPIVIGGTIYYYNAAEL